MASTSAARRYAAAYFDLAGSEGAVDAYRDDLARAVETLDNPEVVAALGNPRLDPGDRVRLALDLIDGLGQSVRNLVRLLVERSRIGALPGILEHYGVLADRATGVVRAEVTTAVAASDAQRRAITAALRETFGAAVDIELRTDPEIIGGLVIRVGDRVIDNSVRTHLQQLQTSLR